jgi:hypothetical protein
MIFKILTAQEPMVHSTIITPAEYLSPILGKTFVLKAWEFSTIIVPDDYVRIRVCRIELLYCSWYLVLNRYLWVAFCVGPENLEIIFQLRTVH